MQELGPRRSYARCSHERGYLDQSDQRSDPGNGSAPCRKSERPQNAKQETLLLGAAPRDMAALSEIVAADAALNLASTLDELTAALANDKVCVVVTPLTTDALDVAQHLASIGYYGQLQILSPELPNPLLVRREIEAVAKSVEVELVTPRAAWRTLA
ncbi:MAG: hypothetical protein ACI9AX_000687 [Polaromonas sp.]|jgi:hypothetical protein